MISAYIAVIALSNAVCSLDQESYHRRTISRLEERYRLWYDGFDDLLNAADDKREALLEGTESLLAELNENLALCGDVIRSVPPPAPSAGKRLCGVEDNDLHQELNMRAAAIDEIIDGLYKIWHKSRVVSGATDGQSPIMAPCIPWVVDDERTQLVEASDSLWDTVRPLPTLCDGNDTPEFEGSGDLPSKDVVELHQHELRQITKSSSMLPRTAAAADETRGNWHSLLKQLEIVIMWGSALVPSCPSVHEPKAQHSEPVHFARTRAKGAQRKAGSCVPQRKEPGGGPDFRTRAERARSLASRLKQLTALRARFRERRAGRCCSLGSARTDGAAAFETGWNVCEDDDAENPTPQPWLLSRLKGVIVCIDALDELPELSDFPVIFYISNRIVATKRLKHRNDDSDGFGREGGRFGSRLHGAASVWSIEVVKLFLAHFADATAEPEALPRHRRLLARLRRLCWTDG